MKKIVSLFLAMSMLVGMSVGAWATQPNEQGDQRIKDIFYCSKPVQNSKEGQYTFVYEEDIPSIKSIHRESAQSTKAITTITIIPTDEKEISILENITRSGGGNHYEYDWDSSGGIKAYCTIYFTRCELDDGREGVKLDKITGGYDRAAHTLRVTDYEVNIAATGDNVTQRKSIDMDKSSWIVYPPSSWKPVFVGNNALTVLGAACNLTISRNSKCWYLELTNHYVYEMWGN